MLSPAFLGKFYTNFIDCAMFYNTAVVQILKLEGKWRLRKKVKASAMILKLHFAFDFCHRICILSMCVERVYTALPMAMVTIV